MANNENIFERCRITMGEALSKLKENQSPLETTTWAIEQFQEVDLGGGAGGGADKENEVLPNLLKRASNRLQKAKTKETKKHKSLSDDELKQPLLTQSEEWLLDPALKPKDPAPKRKPGRPRAVNFEVCSKYEVELIKPLTNKLIAAEDEMGKTATQLCGRIIQALNYTHDRTLGNLGKQIYEGTYGKENGKGEMGIEEAEYMKHHELEISQRKYTDLKLRLDKANCKIPSAKGKFHD
jgi:hypothetical protein